MTHRRVSYVHLKQKKNVHGEYQVKAFDQYGRRYLEADYFTDDLEDAKNTAKAMVKDEQV